MELFDIPSTIVENLVCLDAFSTVLFDILSSLLMSKTCAFAIRDACTVSSLRSLIVFRARYLPYMEMAWFRPSFRHIGRWIGMLVSQDYISYA